MTDQTVPFLDAALGRPAAHTPVWFMRQAGRSLPEYKSVRGEGSILHAIKQPDVAAEITLQPVRRYGVDAAVLYSDIVVPPHAVGFGIDVQPGTGPVAETPFRSRADLDRLRRLRIDRVDPRAIDKHGHARPAADYRVVKGATHWTTPPSFIAMPNPSPAAIAVTSDLAA